MSKHRPMMLEQHPEQESHYPIPASTYYYYVQSPSSPFPHNDTDDSPDIPDNDARSDDDNDPHYPTAQPPAFSRCCSSSRGSNRSSFLRQVKELPDAGCGLSLSDGELQRLVVIDEEDSWSSKTGRRCRSSWWRYLSFSNAWSSASCMALQIGWRLVVSAGVAMLLFCMVTKPPHPRILFKVGGVTAFELVEGVDATGVPTNFFTFNSTLILTIDNRSKFYALRVDPLLLELFFGTFPLVVHRESEGFYAWIQEITSCQVSVGAKNKPMYGAGRIMQDMVESQGGLSLILRIRLRTSYRLLGGIMDVNDYHQSKCLLTLKRGHEDGLGTTTYTYNSTCCT